MTAHRDTLPSQNPHLSNDRLGFADPPSIAPPWPLTHDSGARYRWKSTRYTGRLRSRKYVTTATTTRLMQPATEICTGRHEGRWVVGCDAGYALKAVSAPQIDYGSCPSMKSHCTLFCSSLQPRPSGPNCHGCRFLKKHSC